MPPAVVAIIATFRRPHEVARLLESIDQLQPPLAGVVIVDNGSSSELRAIVEAARCRTFYVDPGRNLGCGGGLRLGEERALALEQVACTHLMILDDDAVLLPDTVEVLLAAMEEHHADLAYPMVLDSEGCVNWIPGIGLSGRQLRKLGKLSPEQFRTRVCGAPHPFTSALGICLLLTRAAIESRGLHRDDFWVRGEDIEFTLRHTRGGLGIFVPGAVVRHLPPSEQNVSSSREAEYLKHCALVQNIAYLGFRLPHGHRIAYTLGGTLKHFFRIWGIKALPDALRGIWRGAVAGEPAGRGSGHTFAAQFAELTRVRP